MKGRGKFFGVLLLSSLLHVSGFSQSADLKTVSLEGKVVAAVESLVTGAGVGPHYYSFIFAASQLGEQKSTEAILVRLLYEQYSENDFLEESFYDYGNDFRLATTRDSKCDASPAEFAFEQFNEKRSSVLKIMKGAEKVRIDDTTVLQCFRLTFKGIKKLR